MYDCVMGLRKHEGQGCILADEMLVSDPRSALLILTASVNKGDWEKPFRLAH
jgi:DNA repair and recombination protein RAD54B